MAKRKQPLKLGNNSALVSHAAALRHDSRAAQVAAQAAKEKARDYRREAHAASEQAKRAIIQSALDQGRLDLVCINTGIVERISYGHNNVTANTLYEMRQHVTMTEQLAELIKKMTASKREIVKMLRNDNALLPEYFNLSPAALKEF